MADPADQSRSCRAPADYSPRTTASDDRRPRSRASSRWPDPRDQRALAPPIEIDLEAVVGLRHLPLEFGKFPVAGPERVDTTPAHAGCGKFSVAGPPATPKALSGADAQAPARSSINGAVIVKRTRDRPVLLLRQYGTSTAIAVYMAICSAISLVCVFALRLRGHHAVQFSSHGADADARVILTSLTCFT